MVIFCPRAIRILLLAIIPDTDAVGMIINFTDRVIEDESREYHESIIANYKINGYKRWLSTLKVKHVFHSDCMDILNRTRKLWGWKALELWGGTSEKWPNYHMVGGGAYNHVRPLDWFNILMDNNNNIINIINNDDDDGDDNGDNNDSDDNDGIVRYLPRTRVSGAGGRLAHMKNTNYIIIAKTSRKHKKVTRKKTKKETRMDRKLNKDMKRMNRIAMKKVQIR